VSAFGCKADMALCGNSLSRSLMGVKRTWVGALHMSAYDPKRTRLVVIPDSGHLSTLEQPAAVTKALVEWLRA
jgi:pimeloyl-ACP methyl ester carboxylesterase